MTTLKDSPEDKLRRVLHDLPAEFAFRAYPGLRFRVSSQRSYVGESGQLWLLVEVKRDGRWQDFCRETPVTIRREMVL